MTQRFELCSGRIGKDGKTFWVRVGTMFQNEKGGYSIKMDALPLPDKDGNVWINAFPPREKNGGGNRAEPRQSLGLSEQLNDDLPPW